jgi:large repetitive protein
MWKSLLLALAANTLHAALIQGTVVENRTGHPLARANVVLEPVTGSGGTRRVLRTNLNGNFQFPSVPAGSYLLTGSRAGFATTQYGQKHWNAAGRPIVVTETDSSTLTLRLPRFGAISGSVLDENDVGLPEYEVVAYRDGRPPLPVARAVSDEWGDYRLSGLPPGRYLVRSAGKQYDDASYLPTFAKQTQIPDQAISMQVELDQQVERLDVRPLPGRLFLYNVSVTTVPPGMPVTMTFVSDLGRESIQANSHTFGPLPAGRYEIYAQAPLDRKPGFQGAYQRVNVTRDDGIGIMTREEPDTQVTFAGDASNRAGIQLLARRNDMAGPGAAQILSFDSNDRVHLSGGPWQVSLQPNAGFYVSGFSGYPNQPASSHPEGWNDIVIGGVPSIKFALTSGSVSVHGTVNSASQTVPGVPVFLEPSDLEPPKRLTETFMTLTDTQGRYQFTGLTPGNYRLLASFDYSTADSSVMSMARARSITIPSGSDKQQDLDLYVGP